jgi:outer membrane lipoprotein-sorting protein
LAKKTWSWKWLWTLAAFLASAAPGFAQTWNLESILRQLDSEAKSFRAMSASIEKTKVTVIVNDRSTETGQISVRGDKMLIELEKPDSRTILRDGDKLFVYTPRTKRLEEYDLGKHKALVDQFLLLGFGSSGGDLKKGYLPTFLGEQSLDKKRVLLLELTPKEEKVRAQIARIHLWLDMSTWLPVQQRFYETGSGDYFEMHYTSILRNPRIPDSKFKPKWPKGITRTKPLS